MSTALSTFRARGISTLSFDFAALKPLQRLYWQVYADQLPDSMEMGLKLHEEGQGFQHVTMRWFFANSNAAMARFREVLDSTGVRHCRDFIGHDRSLVRVVQANLIEIRGSYPTGTWHTDFTDDQIQPRTCLTVLTPLFPFASHFGGLETTSAPRDHPQDYARCASSYQYRAGEAIVFDGSATIHRTQSYVADPEERRVLVSWQIAECDPVLRPRLDRIASRNGDPMFYEPHAETAP